MHSTEGGPHRRPGGAKATPTPKQLQPINRSTPPVFLFLAWFQWQVKKPTPNPHTAPTPKSYEPPVLFFSLLPTTTTTSRELATRRGREDGASRRRDAARSLARRRVVLCLQSSLSSCTAVVVVFHRSQVRPGDTLCSIALRCHVPPQVKLDPAVHSMTWHDIKLTLSCSAAGQVRRDARARAVRGRERHARRRGALRARAPAVRVHGLALVARQARERRAGGQHAREAVRARETTEETRARPRESRRICQYTPSSRGERRRA